MYKTLPKLPEDWHQVLKPYLAKDCLKQIDEKLSAVNHIVYPPKESIFRAFELTPFNDVKVLLLGQDPYHGDGEACGISFGVSDHVKPPPSLKNIMKELKHDLDQILESYELAAWAKQGLLMLNRTLTVVKDQPLSHKNIGWDEFVDAVMQAILKHKESVVFVALGKESESFFKKYQQKFGKNHKLLCFPHPSPLSAHRGFFGSKMFSKINQTLDEMGLESITFGTNS